MNEKESKVHPKVPTARWHVQIGGVSKNELMQRLNEQHIALNAYAEQLFADPRFTTSEIRRTLLAVEVSVTDLGFREGATLPQVFHQASKLGLALAPLELAVYLRLQYQDQNDGGSAGKPGSNQAPAGSITIASEPLSADDEIPKGFYLRNIDGTLWLRGYRCDADHRWRADDRFVFTFKI